MRLFLSVILIFAMWATKLHVVAHNIDHNHKNCTICESIGNIHVKPVCTFEFLLRAPVHFVYVEPVHSWIGSTFNSQVIARGPPLV